MAEKKKMQRPEEDVQKAGLQLIHLIYPVGITFHIPNQRMGMNLRMILKALGVRAGIPDVGVVRPYGRIGWIEFKKPGELRKKDKGLTDSQKELHPQMEKLWHHVHLIDDVTQLQPILAEWRAEDRATEEALRNAA